MPSPTPQERGGSCHVTPQRPEMVLSAHPRWKQGTPEACPGPQPMPRRKATRCRTSVRISPRALERRWIEEAREYRLARIASGLDVLRFALDFDVVSRAQSVFAVRCD